MSGWSHEPVAAWARGAETRRGTSVVSHAIPSHTHAQARHGVWFVHGTTDDKQLPFLCLSLFSLDGFTVVSPELPTLDCGSHCATRASTLRRQPFNTSSKRTFLNSLALDAATFIACVILCVVARRPASGWRSVSCARSRADADKTKIHFGSSGRARSNSLPDKNDTNVLASASARASTGESSDMARRGGNALAT